MAGPRRVNIDRPQFFPSDPNDPKRYVYTGTPATDEEIAEQQKRNQGLDQNIMDHHLRL